MKLPYTKSGKCGTMVWQRNRYGPICYPAFIPRNPRTPAQQAIRGIFGAVSKRWRTLTEAQRLDWIAVANTILSKPRLAQCGPLTGCQWQGRRSDGKPVKRQTETSRGAGFQAGRAALQSRVYRPLGERTSGTAMTSCFGSLCATSTWVAWQARSKR